MQLNKLLKKKLSEIKLPMHKFSKKIQTKFVKLIRKNHEKKVVFLTNSNCIIRIQYYLIIIITKINIIIQSNNIIFI